MRVPRATYRLQFNDDFSLHDARAILPYLARLGISDLYLSPVFEAPPGSPHGYDVTDPTRVRASIGGESALHELADAARGHDMGILLDTVPNHMAASPHNPWWRDVLEHGQRSPYAHFFDIDWAAPGADGRLRLPILGDVPAAVLERGEIGIDLRNSEVVYFETRLPLAPGSVAGDAAALAGEDRPAAVRRVLDRQHYELIFWRDASSAMNYRRFFDITDLAAVRVELADVFDVTHSLVRRLAADGVITGLRIDHIDGLRDPAGYLRRLRDRVRGEGGEPVYTVVEKILERDEALPGDWECEGTSGYEFLTLATGVLIHPAGYEQLNAFYARVTGDAKPFSDLVREKKLFVMDRLFAGELTTLARDLAPLAGIDGESARAALAHVTACMSVYRTYTRSRRVHDDDRVRIEKAAADATLRRPDLAREIDAVRRVALLEAAPVSDATLGWVMRWQQFTGPVMAKGFEDTALYCHNALLAANEVGSDPVAPSIGTAALHRALAARRDRWPGSLNATATHDTKRGEDTRARIAVISEVADEWAVRLRRWIRQGDAWKAELAESDDIPVPEADVDSLLYQTVVGAWTPEGADDAFKARIKAYMTKAVREAKEQTSWRRPDQDFEQALAAFVDRLMDDFGRAGLAEDVAAWADRLAPHGAVNSIAQVLLKIAAPGVPDFYQGTELWSLTLVDPDNRRPVDYELRARVLDELSPHVAAPGAAGMRAALESWQDGRVKMLVTALALQCRGRHPDLFGRGDYFPITVVGARADHVVAFARILGNEACLLAVPRWTARLAGQQAALPTGARTWRDTHLALPSALRRTWRNALTGESYPPADSIALSDLFATAPFCLLE
jgi:(1->4)-alpha-D-glucan 1-alpha-D-glucosylmutase